MRIPRTLRSIQFELELLEETDRNVCPTGRLRFLPLVFSVFVGATTLTV